MNWADETLRARLAQEIAAGTIRIEPDAIGYWSWLNQTFPAAGSKIDLEAVAWLVDYPQWQRRFASARDLWRDACERVEMQGVNEVIVVDDGRVSYSVIGSPAALADCIVEIQSIMLHLFAFVPERRICFCVTMEGDAFLCGM